MKTNKRSKGNDRVSEELRPEYHFDYSKAKPNRFATRAGKGTMVVVLDEEIARVFKTPESVRAVLRAIAATMPPRRRRVESKRTAER